MKSIHIIIISVFLQFTFIKSILSQNSDSLKITKNHFSFIGSFQRGYVFPTNRFLSGDNSEHEKTNSIQAFSLKFIKQTTGNNDWQVNYNYPTYGVGIYSANFFNPDELGSPIALYGLFAAPFHRWKKLSLDYELGLGIAFNWKCYNPINNPENISIGAKQSVYLDAGMGLNYMINKRFSLLAGFSLSHFSNGALKQPNFGINTIAPKLNLRYNLQKDDIKYEKQKLPAFKKKNEWLFSIFGGAKNVIFDSLNIGLIAKYEGVDYLVTGFSTSYNRQISYKSKLGFGVELNYDGAYNAQVAIANNSMVRVKSPFTDKLQLSVFPSYELVVDRLSFLFQPSFYVVRKKTSNMTPVFFQRLGLKYYVSKNLFAGMNLRAFQFHVSDFLEWNVGYSFN